MNDKFSIAADQERAMIRIALAGLIALDDVGHIREACRDAIATLGLPKNAHRTITDVRELKILPQETLAAFCEMLADPEHHSRRIAFVVAPTLVRAQVSRALGGRKNARCFDDPAKAEAWLFEEEAAAESSRRVG